MNPALKHFLDVEARVEDDIERDDDDDDDDIEGALQNQ